MSWSLRRKQHGSVYQVHEYASQLGVERRKNPRAKYPSQNLSSLPSVFYGSYSVPVQDVSVGGVCLLDVEDRLEQQTGNEVEFRLIWPDGEQIVRSRIVARVNPRVHVQFLNLNPDRAEAISKAIVPGIRGTAMRPVDHPHQRIQLDAEEIYTSVHGDSLVINKAGTIIAGLNLLGREYTITRHFWPKIEKKYYVSPLEFEAILIFMANIPQASERCRELLKRLQSLYFEGRL